MSAKILSWFTACNFINKKNDNNHGRFKVVTIIVSVVIIALASLWAFNKYDNEKTFDKRIAMRFDETMEKAYPFISFCAQAMLMQKELLEKNAVIAKSQYPYDFQNTFIDLNRRTHFPSDNKTIFNELLTLNTFKSSVAYLILENGGKLREKESKALTYIVRSEDEPEFSENVEPDSLINGYNNVIKGITECLNILSKYNKPETEINAWMEVNDMKYNYIFDEYEKRKNWPFNFFKR